MTDPTDLIAEVDAEFAGRMQIPARRLCRELRDALAAALDRIEAMDGYRQALDLAKEAAHHAIAERDAANARAEAAGCHAKAMEAENAHLKNSVIAFCAPHAARYSREFGFPEGHLHPTHYDILANAGARMDDFTRAALTGGAQR